MKGLRLPGHLRSRETSGERIVTKALTSSTNNLKTASFFLRYVIDLFPLKPLVVIKPATINTRGERVSHYTKRGSDIKFTKIYASITAKCVTYYSLICKLLVN